MAPYRVLILPTTSSYADAMSFDGSQCIWITRLSDGTGIDDIADELLAEAADQVDYALRYRFGYGETGPVELSVIEDIVTLPWEQWPDVGEYEEMSYIVAGDAKKALQTLHRFLEDRVNATERICDVLDEYGYGELEPEAFDCDTTAPDTEDAESTGSRYVQVLMCLAESLRRAITSNEVTIVFNRLGQP